MLNLQKLINYIINQIYIHKYMVADMLFICHPEGIRHAVITLINVLHR